MSAAELSGSTLRIPRRGVDLDALRRIGPLKKGIPRSQVTVPISEAGRVDDTVLYLFDAHGPAAA